MDPVATLFLSLLVAHLLADFVLQSDSDIARKEAEYILIGTLMSFGWGLAAARGTRYLLDAF